MSLVLDSGALIGIERRDPRLLADLLVAQRRAIPVVTSAGVVAQVWRDGAGQAHLARHLKGIDQRSINPAAAREVGTLLGVTRTTDIVDAHVSLIAGNGDVVRTSDPGDIERLLAARNSRAVVVGL
ncbi:MAG: hypothetical protein QM655_08160 [Nocardioidaceae bacterium]